MNYEIIKTMNKEAFIKKLTLILEDFDSNREADMKYFLDDIYSASEIYFADVIKEEREKAIKEFLIEQLKRGGLETTNLSKCSKLNR